LEQTPNPGFGGRKYATEKEGILGERGLLGEEF